MNPLKILIVEDEIIIAEDLKGMLESLGYDAPNYAISYDEAIEFIEQDQPDLVLVDIILKGEKDGVDVARYLRRQHDLPFIFVTSHADPATIERVKEVQPYGYVVKPFEEKDVFSAIEIAWSNYERERASHAPATEPPPAVVKDSIFIRHKKLMVKVKLVDILWLRADGNYTEIHTRETKYVLRTTLKDIERNLDSARFMRVHKSYIVQLDAITATSMQKLYIGETELPIGRSYVQDLLTRINMISAD